MSELFYGEKPGNRLQRTTPPIPDDRDDVEFTPIMCDLVPHREP